MGLNSRRNFTCLFREVPTLKTLINEQGGYVSTAFSRKRVLTRLLGISEYLNCQSETTDIVILEKTAGIIPKFYQLFWR